VREIEVPFVRRHVRALGHVTKVAQVALVDHVPVILLRHPVHFAGRSVVDQVEQGRERPAQADAAPAAVADVEDAFHLLERGVLVVEPGVLPIQRVARRRLQRTFPAHGLPFLPGVDTVMKILDAVRQKAKCIPATGTWTLSALGPAQL
jgi:hypothetical protein